MAFPPQFLDEIRTRVSVSSVVGRRAKLIKRGREYVCLSPFTNEKTPSFTINDDKGFYHCFSSGEHGDIFKFVMKMQNLSFPEAVERLAEEAGLEMPKQSAEEVHQAEQGARGREAVEAACKLYEETLHSAEGRRGLEYLKSRGLSDETIARFRLGFAPNGNVIKTKFKARGVKEDILLETRLLSPGKEGRDSFDFFRNRVMFPIFDLRGRPVAFGGRVMDPEDQPKYLNSPDTPLFHKGQLLYGMALAREAAAAKREIIVAEGYMDVIALAQAGFQNAVAPLGTAMTENQIELLWRMSPEPILCFDGDKAGRGAAIRAANRAWPMLRPGFSLRFAMMPQGKDPDDLCRSEEGRSTLAGLLTNAISLFEVMWSQFLEEHKTDTPERRAGLDQAIEKKTALIADGTVREQYKKLFKERLSELFYQKRFQKGTFKKSAKTNPGSQKLFPEPERHKPPSDIQKQEKAMVAIAFHHPDTFDEIAERMNSIEFKDDAMRGVWSAIMDTRAERPDADAKMIASNIAAAGHGQAIQELSDPWFLKLHKAADPESSKEDALQAWMGAYNYLVGRALEKEATQLAEDFSDEAVLERFAREQAVSEELRKRNDSE